MSEPRTRPLRILLVEDHEDTATVLAAMLRRAGHQVFAADGFSTALILAAALASVDLLLSDITLPDGSGCDLLPLLRERTSGGVTSAIAMTGHGEDEWVERCQRAGFGHVLVKPVSFDALLRAVAAVRASEPV
jgi:two-component system CheB/CheR fusion protein